MEKKKKMDNNILHIITSYLKGRPNETQVKEVVANKALQEEIIFAREMQFTQAHKEEIQVQNILKDILAHTPDVQADDELTEQLLQEDIIQLPKTGGSNAWIWGSSLLIGLIGMFAVAFYGGLFNMNTAAEIEGLRILEEKIPHYMQPDMLQKEAVDMAVFYYNKENFEVAIPYYEDYLNSEGYNDNSMKLYLALSYLHNKQYENSISIFQEIERTTFTSKHIDYYMGIALLMNDETEAAASSFKQIQKENEHYQSSKHILQKIEKE